ncbi:MAG: membrane peptidoglycan carboxypeptidase [Candidatus Saccharimonadales bacterium]|jgi:membrane peptidoglycan carboxypeptidase
MAKSKKSRLSASKPKSRRVKGNKFTTKSGKIIKVNKTLTQRVKARKDAKALRKAERNKGLPKSKVKRTLYKLHPVRQYKYWFSRDGVMTALRITGIGIVLGFFFLIGLFAYFRKDLPNLRDVSGDNIGGSIRYYDRSGETLLWEDYDAVKRVPVESEDISQHLKNATIALEDRDFYDHSGFNVRGISRAAWNNAFGGDIQGGSTITQQLVKLTTPGFANEKTVTRKIKELIIAVELERSYSKDEILTGYLNAAPYGTIEYGAEVAARTYFQKSAAELTIDESAFLATIPKSPPTYTPHSPAYKPDEVEARQDFTLDVMHELGMITEQERDDAKAIDTLANLKKRPPSKYTGILAPHFVLAAKDQLVLEQGNSYQTGGWKVITTLDMKLQTIAEEEVTSGVAQIERQRGNTAAFVAEDVTNGQVVALVGGADFNDKDRAGEVNFAQQPLPPGSSFKPYDYLALIENTENSGAGSVLYDTQGPIEGYPCTNKSRPRSGGNCLWDYDFRFPGPLTLRYSLGGSRNVPAVKAMLIAGVGKTIQTANDLGLYDSRYETGGYKCYEPGDETFTIEIDCYASSAIGDGAYLNLDKHVHAFSTISRNGNKIPQTYILRVEDSEGRTLTEWEPSNGEQVVRAESAYIISDMMADPRASYMSRKNHDYKGWDFSLKTGTTNDNKDGWLMGFSTKYSAGVWVGHHTGQVEMSGFMETMTQPIWNTWMQRAHDEIDPVARARPQGLQEIPAYVVTKHVGVSSREPSPSTDLFPSWYRKPGASSNTEKIIKDKVSEKRAFECTPPLALEEVDESDAISFSADPFYDSVTNSEDEDDVHKCEDVKPTVTLDVIDNADGTYTLNVSVGAGTHPINSEKFPGQLNILIASQAIPNGSIQIGGPGVYSVDYTSIYDTTETVQVEIIDSVLYQTIDARDVSLTLPGILDPPEDSDE